ncbi:hypothetical protein HMPREF1868_01344 [Olsenella sp. DNF00959]|nr:hypothetical protein HMPREF1868_01344 [Olsenella sp. DNF00959]
MDVKPVSHGSSYSFCARTVSGTRPIVLSHGRHPGEIRITPRQTISNQFMRLTHNRDFRGNGPFGSLSGSTIISCFDYYLYLPAIL